MSDPTTTHQADLHQGRNTPCSCGSGKKFKHCCLLASIRAGASAVEQAMATSRNAVAARPCAECRKPAPSLAVPGYVWRDASDKGTPVLMPLCLSCLRAAVARVLDTCNPEATSTSFPTFVPAKLELRDDYAA